MTEAEAALVRAQTEVCEQLRDSVRVLPAELHTLLGQPPVSFDVSDVPTLYLYGEHTESPSFLTAGEVAAIFPQAETRALPGQRHLAPVFDPAGFATAILEFTGSGGFRCQHKRLPR